MDVQIFCRSTERMQIIDYCVKYFSKKLKLRNSKYQLEVRSIYDLRGKEKCNGQVYQNGIKSICMQLDNRLSLATLLITIAHEMVHVKQIAKGQYRGKFADNGKVLSCWRGKPVKAAYRKRPWEVEAYKRQTILVEMMIANINKLAKNNKK